MILILVQDVIYMTIVFKINQYKFKLGSMIIIQII